MHTPATRVASVRKSGRPRVVANRNADYERKIEQEKQHKAKCNLEQQTKDLHKQGMEAEVEDPARGKPNVTFKECVEDDDDAHFAGLANTGLSNDNLPASLTKALDGPDRAKWKEALQEELTNLETNNVYKEVLILEGVTPFTSKGVMHLKFDAVRNVTRYKVHIVARGFAQKEGVDYQEVFAPVANLESIRIIIALAAKYNLELDQMDVSAAYLNGELDKELYMMPPTGVQIKPGHCWHLHHSLYGLKQAG